MFQFLEVAKNNHAPLNSFEVFTTLAYTGMRAGELLALKWSDIDFENNTISITKTYYNPNNNKKKYQILTPKTESSIGKITVDANVIKMLHDYKINVQENWKDELYADNNFVFTDNNGYPLVIKNYLCGYKLLCHVLISTKASQRTRSDTHIVHYSLRLVCILKRYKNAYDIKISILQ